MDLSGWIPDADGLGLLAGLAVIAGLWYMKWRLTWGRIGRR